MSLLKKRVAETDQKLKELKQARKALDKTRRDSFKQSKAERDRKVMLVGEAVLRRVQRGEWDEADFRRMMDESLTRPSDRALFHLEV